MFQCPRVIPPAQSHPLPHHAAPFRQGCGCGAPRRTPAFPRCCFPLRCVCRGPPDVVARQRASCAPGRLAARRLRCEPPVLPAAGGALAGGAKAHRILQALTRWASLSTPAAPSGCSRCASAGASRGGLLRVSAGGGGESRSCFALFRSDSRLQPGGADALPLGECVPQQRWRGAGNAWRARSGRRAASRPDQPSDMPTPRSPLPADTPGPQCSARRAACSRSC